MKLNSNSLVVTLITSLLINLIFILRSLQVTLLSSNVPEVPYTCPTSGHRSEYNVLLKEHAENFSALVQKSRSATALRTASLCSSAVQLGLREGRLGWLWLLAAVDLDRSNIEAVYNLVQNYESLYSGFSSLAYSELLSSSLSVSDKERIMDKQVMKVLEDEFNSVNQSLSNSGTIHEPCNTKIFVTLISQWNMYNSNLQNLIDELNDVIYNHSVNEYERLKLLHPSISSTELNHAFFRFQMSQLEQSSSYWGGFQKIPGFEDLVAMMRQASRHFLQDHGFDADTAMRKASQPLVVWVSIHTAESVHQPHVTDDALVGGVYYVRTPTGSGRLELYDPRGKNPLRDLAEPTSPPFPPFHRTVTVVPKAGHLLLFPGWLVHSVVTAESLVADADEIESTPLDGYRVSLSLNLKGEWQDTAALHFRNCEL